MNTKYLKLRDLILESEGRKLEDELGFGCQVKYLSGREYMMDDKEYELRLGDEEIVEVFGEGDAKFGIYSEERDCPIIEILGKPIPLARILIALGAGVAINLETNSKGETVLECCGFVWNLVDEDGNDEPLHNQTEETMDKLTQILCTKPPTK